MRKQLVNKTAYSPLTPTLTSGRLINLQEFLFRSDNLEKERNLAEIVSDETRLKILYLLTKEKYLSVGDIADILKSQRSGISHQLSVLRREHLVKTRKKGRVVFYFLEKTLPAVVGAAIGLL